MNMKFAKFSMFSAVVFPILASAQTSQTLSGILAVIDDILSAIVPILIALAVIFFMWGLVKYILASSDTGAAAEGKSMMIWGIVALFVMVTIWGLVATLGNVVGVAPGSGTIPSSSELIPSVDGTI